MVDLLRQTSFILSTSPMQRDNKKRRVDNVQEKH